MNRTIWNRAVPKYVLDRMDAYSAATATSRCCCSSSWRSCAARLPGQEPSGRAAHPRLVGHRVSCRWRRCSKWSARNTVGFFRGLLRSDQRPATQNKRLKKELGRSRWRTSSSRPNSTTADRAQLCGIPDRALPSRTSPPGLSAAGPAPTRKVVFVDRGSLCRRHARAMAVVTPDGIVGKVFAAYPRFARSC